MKKIDFIMGVYDGNTFDSVADELKQLTGTDVEVKRKYQTTPAGLLETTVDNFEALFGARPIYGENGWFFTPDKTPEIPTTLAQKIEYVELNRRMKLA